MNDMYKKELQKRYEKESIVKQSEICKEYNKQKILFKSFWEFLEVHYAKQES